MHSGASLVGLVLVWKLQLPAGISVVSFSCPLRHKPTSFHYRQFRTDSPFITVASSQGHATQAYFLTCAETKCNCRRQILVCHTIPRLQKWVCLTADHFTMDPAIKAAYIVYQACQISGNSLVLPHLTLELTAQTALRPGLLLVINFFKCSLIIHMIN